MRVVLDTNVLISALLFRGRPEQLLFRCLQPDAALITSAYILEEVERVLGRKSNWSDEIIAAALQRLRTASEVVSPAVQVNVCRDPDDDRILETAITGAADYIVSGDADLLTMGTFRGVQMISVAAFLNRFSSAETR